MVSSSLVKSFTCALRARRISHCFSSTRIFSSSPVSVESQTSNDDLNIANDITQVGFILFLFCFFLFRSMQFNDESPFFAAYMHSS